MAYDLKQIARYGRTDTKQRAKKNRLPLREAGFCNEVL
ncbi:hypothetical protein SBC1_55300 (plasmid) [Caballeronia sp. SBC1]|nr:hypothetical protein SBC2_54990 [Caballeronia sp. SBC2]QIN65485.1 hypothetical protein SBC1_55300 [Caballeronia sp. SBC1]